MAHENDNPINKAVAPNLFDATDLPNDQPVNEGESDPSFGDDALGNVPDDASGVASFDLSDGVEDAAHTESNVQRYRRRFGHLPSSRELLLGWCIWLLVSLALSQQLGAFGPSSRWMIFSCMVGMLLMWPALRLSQDSSVPRWLPDDRKPGEHDTTSKAFDSSGVIMRSRLTPMLILRDWLCLVTVFQVVVWTMRYTTSWTIQQTIWLDVAIAAWSLLVAMFVALGCWSVKGFHRTLMMGLILVLVLGEPVFYLLDVANMVNHATPNNQPGSSIAHDNPNWLDWKMVASPIDVLYALTASPVKFKLGQLPIRIICVAAAAVVGWLGLILFHFIDERRFKSR